MSKAEKPFISIVVPCFNEAEVLAETNSQLLAVLDDLKQKGKITPGSCLYYIDDGSSDSTWQLICDMHAQSKHVRGIKLASNVGHQNALIAGLTLAEGDALISIDADLQDDISVIEKMVDQFIENRAQVVYGIRSRRDTDSVFKRQTAQTFYRVMRLMGVDIHDNHADFRLMGRNAVEALKQFDEVNLFLRGIVPLIGFTSAVVHYDRRARSAGVSKYPLRKMIGLAIDGITSFSVVPLRIIALLGFITFTFSSVLGMWALVAAFFSDSAVPGWASTVLPIYFLGGIQLLGLGVIGEYIGKVYQEVKRRPRFLVENTLG